MNIHSLPDQRAPGCPLTQQLELTFKTCLGTYTTTYISLNYFLLAGSRLLEQPELTNSMHRGEGGPSPCSSGLLVTETRRTSIPSAI